MTVQQSYLFCQIEEFYALLQKGEYDHPLDLAKKLQELSDQAWDQVEELYQSCVCIVP